MHAVRCNTALAIVSSWFVIGCGDPGRVVDPAASASRASSDAARAAVVSAGPDTRLVSMMDACDSASFNAVLGAGGCSRPGGLDFSRFIALLGAHQSVGAWHNAPSHTNARLGQMLVAVNRGGEVHTFTRVANFGGGIVPQLNQLSGNPVPAPECLQAPPSEFVPPGGTDIEALDVAGTIEFQCCIHPWMRTTVTVR